MAMLAAPYRREHRFACTQTDTSVSLGAGVPLLSASVTDVSRNGLKIEVEREIPVGASIDVAFERLLVKGVIRYCRSITPGRFEVGVLIRETARQPRL